MVKKITKGLKKYITIWQKGGGTPKIISPNPWLEKGKNEKKVKAREKRIKQIKTPKGFIKNGVVLNKDGELCVWFVKHKKKRVVKAVKKKFIIKGKKRIIKIIPRQPPIAEKYVVISPKKEIS